MTDAKDELRDRFEEHTEDTGGTRGAQDSDTTRSRSQYPMYLSEALQDELDETFKRYNAERTLDGQEEVEKHKDFLKEVVRAGLKGEWTDHVKD